MTYKILKLFVFTIASICLFSCTKELDASLVFAQSDESDIISFNLLQSNNSTLVEVDKLGIINEENRTIDFLFPFGSDITAVIPKITISEEATISPESGTAQDFTTPVTYTVTAEDGTESTYIITINLPELSERQALINMYNSTTNPGLIWDLEAEDINTWARVTAVDGKVIELSIDDDLTLNITSDIKNLIHLEHFDVYNTRVNFVDELGSLTTLKTVNLEFTDLSSGIDWIGNLINLEELVIDESSDNTNNIAALDFSKLKKLTRLRMAVNGTTSLPNSLNELTSLTSLDLEENSIIALPDDLSGLVNLKNLRISDNNLSDITPITQITNIETLTLSDNSITTIPVEISNLTKLTSLFLNGNSNIVDITPLTQLTSLQGLGLSELSIASIPIEINNLTNLVELNLSTNSTLSNITPILSLTNLRSLNLGSNSITSLPRQIGNLTNLTTLTLSGNSITIVPAEIGNLSELKRLSLSFNMIDNGGIPEELGRLIGLTSLALTNNLFTTIPNSVCNLRNTGTNLSIDADVLSCN